MKRRSIQPQLTLASSLKYLDLEKIGGLRFFQ